jgi:hypothetical protein
VTAAPLGGEYIGNVTVTLTPSETATIHYTTDGSTPSTSSTVYSSPIFLTEDTTLKYFAKDLAGNEGDVGTQAYTIVPESSVEYPFTHMEDVSATVGLSLYSGRQSHVEFVSATSQLVGDKIDSITLRLKKTGAPTGFAEIGVFNTDLTVKKQFGGSLDVSILTAGYVDYTFVLSGGELYTIEAGDRIGIKFTGGDASNVVAVMTDNNSADPFDSTNSYRQHFIASWASFTEQDLYMILKQTHG